MSGATYALTVRQPWADLIVAGVKDVENRTWQPPSTLDPWFTCPYCPVRWRGSDGTPPGRCGGGGSHHGPAQFDGPFPFTIAIHAAAKPDLSANARPVWQQFAVDSRFRGDLVYGAVVGTVTVTGCHHADECWEPEPTVVDPGARGPGHCSRWAQPDCWHWTLTDPTPLDTPVPAKGRLGLWKLAEVPS